MKKHDERLFQIRSIRSLQPLGSTLEEVAEYYYNTENSGDYISLRG